MGLGTGLLTELPQQCPSALEWSHMSIEGKAKKSVPRHRHPTTTSKKILFITIGASMKMYLVP
jgi:hypothetical protein